MESDRTTIAVQRYLDAIADDPQAETLIRGLLEQAVRRLEVLCAHLLRRSYPRLARPPMSVRPEELLSAVIERLMKALRAVRPGNVRQFFALANKHMRWELNELARTLDQRPPPLPIGDGAVPFVPPSSVELTPTMVRILESIDVLPPDEREAFDLVRIQGLGTTEAAELLEVSTKTIQRRINRAMLLLSETLGDLRPAPDERDST